MKERDLLDILGEIDEELIEDAAPIASSERVARPKKLNFGWIKPFSIAASFVILLGGVIAAKPIYDLINSADIIEPGENDETQEDFDGGDNNLPNDGDLEGVPDDGNVEESPNYGDEEVSPPQGNVGGSEGSGSSWISSNTAV